MIEGRGGRETGRLYHGWEKLAREEEWRRVVKKEEKKKSGKCVCVCVCVGGCAAEGHVVCVYVGVSEMLEV